MGNIIGASQEAKQSATQMKNILNGELLSSIQSLKTQGDLLSDPNEWTGRYANSFRSNWPQYKQTLTQIHNQLLELQQYSNSVITNIFDAAGGV